jgi:hypothetical protein
LFATGNEIFKVLSVKRAGFKNPRKLATRIAEEVILTAKEI